MASPDKVATATAGGVAPAASKPVVGSVIPATGPKPPGATLAPGLPQPQVTKLAPGAIAQPPVANVQPVVKQFKGPQFTIMPLSTAQAWLKACFYGFYGVGKTTLAGSAADVPAMRDIFVASCEAGSMSLRGKESTQYSDEVIIKNYSTLAQVQDFLKAHCMHRDKGDLEKLAFLEIMFKKARWVGMSPEQVKVEEDKIKANPRQYHTCIVDSLTEAEAYSFYQLLDIQEGTPLDEEVMEMTWGIYGKNRTKIQRLIRSFRDLPMHVIFICAENEGDKVQGKKSRPAMTGKLAKEVQGFMDVVGYLAIANVEVEDPDILGGKKKVEMRRLFVQPSTIFEAKNRLSAFKDKWIDEPTIEKILKLTGLEKEIKVRRV